MTALTNAQLIQSARVHAMRNAVVAGLKTRFADVSVQAHPGKLDMSDVLKKGVFTAPSIHVAAARVSPDERLSGAEDFVVEMTAYVVAEDLIVAGARVERDEMALAICEAIVLLLGDDQATRWGLMHIGEAMDAKASPLFTLKSFTEGAVYWAVTWRQTLYSVGLPIYGARYTGEPQL